MMCCVATDSATLYEDLQMVLAEMKAKTQAWDHLMANFPVDTKRPKPAEKLLQIFKTLQDFDYQASVFSSRRERQAVCSRSQLK